MHTHFEGSLQTRSIMAVAPAAPVPDSPDAPASPGAAGPVTFPFQRLDVYRVTLELARVVSTASIADAELRDQATRAAKSAFLNLCEGLPDDRKAVRRRYFLQADGSVHEVVGALDLAAAIGALDGGTAGDVIALAARVRAMLRGLLR
jgi:four helix bundle protein